MLPHGHYYMKRSPLASALARTLRGGFCFWGLGTKLGQKGWVAKGVCDTNTQRRSCGNGDIGVFDT